MLINTESFILTSRKYSDSSKIVNFYTREYGKGAVIAKGALSPKSKFGSSLEPLSYSMLTYNMRPGRDLHTLQNAETAKPLRKISTSLDHLVSGLLIAESIIYSMDEKESHPELFDYLIKCIELLNKLDDNPFSVFVAFQFKLAEALGFFLDFTLGRDTNINYQKKFLFSIPDGAPVELNKPSGRVFALSADTIRVLDLIYKLPLEESINIATTNADKNQINDFFVTYFSYHLEKKFTYKSFNLILA